ncbi:MAG: anti-sigma factor antagonist [Firmicutes bacterium]|nr:anti-sigma factor antagonist [Bacillota bacterium]
MKVKTKYYNSVLVVAPAGELDHHTAAELKSAMETELAKGIARDIVLDLRHLSFMDSSGLGVVLGRYKQLARWQGRMVAFGLQPAVEKVYKLSGLPKLIPVHPDLDTCLDSLGG